MNVGTDIGQLSYKELQALAVRYRVPGNIKKKLLVRILQTARCGNKVEFNRLLQELKKTRKRKTRKSKDSKLGITSTPLHSPDYIMADDDYYYQQQQQQLQHQSLQQQHQSLQQQHQSLQQQQQPQRQQPPYQWIGAEEEIMSKDDDNKIPHYEEFKQFLLKRIQREFQTCDTNNNQVQDLSVMDLRTATVSPNIVQSIPIDMPNYSKTNLINDIDPLMMTSIDRPSYQILKEAEENSQGPFLLKRMLQAPVGANLGEIANPLFWTSNLLDNSDTLTAESESNENADQFEANTNEYYGLIRNARGELLLNEANFRNVEGLVPQVPNVLANDDQYRYPCNMDNRQNYQNWIVTSVEVPEGDTQSSKILHAIYYNNTEPTVATNTDNLAYQYQLNTEATCNGNQNFLNFDTQGTNYVTETDAMASDTADIYYLQNVGKHNGEISAGYSHNVEPLVQNNVQPNIYANTQQSLSNNVRSNSDDTYQYFHPRFTQEADNTLHERLEPQQSDSNIITRMENNVNQGLPGVGSIQGLVNGIVDSFWPKWTASNNLENILNYHASKQVDYRKLAQTSCVYCYIAPIVSQRSNLVNNICSQTLRYTVEQRQHSFSPYSLLYNDTSQGMRMTNISNNLFGQSTTKHMTSILSNFNNRKESVNNTEISMNDVWINQYEQVSIAEDINVQVSDSLFYNVAVDRIDDIPIPDIAKT